MKTVVIIPARMDSKRLPGKHLRKINGYEMLFYLVKRMSQTPGIDTVLIATTDRSCDDPLVQWAHRVGVDTFLGDLNDVLGRFTAAASFSDADVVVKANGDSPLLAPEVIAAGLLDMSVHGYEFVTGKNKYTGLPTGLSVEIIRYDTLYQINQKVVDPFDREHITNYIFRFPQSFKWKPITVKPEWVAPELSLTVDTLEDFQKMTQLINALDKDKTCLWSVEQIISVNKKQHAI